MNSGKDDARPKLCSECEKPNVFRYSKTLCQACYNKIWRNTDKGKECTKAYNLSPAGKEAQKKFRERKRAGKPPKPPKLNCECGKPSYAKNLCMSCYQRKRYVKKEPSRERNTLNRDIIYKRVLDYVKKGCTILNACKKAGLKSTSSMYRIMTPLQKAELNLCKKIGIVDDDYDF
jgi:hypothetical protein